jgi:Holliday junction resolvase RusA-like endonuclease
MTMLVVDHPGPLVPYTRVGRERWTKRATRYLSGKDALAWTLKEAAAKEGLPEGGLSGEWFVNASFYRHAALGDIDNLLKAVLDAGNGIIWTDDRFVIGIVARRHPAAQGEDRTELLLLGPGSFS